MVLFCYTNRCVIITVMVFCDHL